MYSDYDAKKTELLERLSQLSQENNGNEIRKTGSNSTNMANYHEVAELYLLEAEKLGVIEAHTDLGVLYNHHFTPPDREKAFRHYLEGSRQGDKRAIRLFLRDGEWFDYIGEYTEIIDLAVKHGEPKGILIYAGELASEGKIDEAINTLTKIYELNPHARIDSALIKLQNDFEEGEILNDLIEFALYWHNDILLFSELETLGDDDWFTYYYLNIDNYFGVLLDILAKILKRDADKGNADACFAYALFTRAGICMEEPNFTDSVKYLNKAIKLGLKNGKEIQRKFDDPLYDTDIISSYIPDVFTDCPNDIGKAIESVVNNKNKVISINKEDFIMVPKYYLQYNFYDISRFDVAIPVIEYEITDMIFIFTSNEDIKLVEVNRIKENINKLCGREVNIVYGFHKFDNQENTLDIFIL